MPASPPGRGALENKNSEISDSCFARCPGLLLCVCLCSTCRRFVPQQHPPPHSIPSWSSPRALVACAHRKIVYGEMWKAATGSSGANLTSVLFLCVGVRVCGCACALTGRRSAPSASHRCALRCRALCRRENLACRMNIFSSLQLPDLLEINFWRLLIRVGQRLSFRRLASACSSTKLLLCRFCTPGPCARPLRR